MTDVVNYLINLLTDFAKLVPLPFFTFFGAMIEEIIAPIPSPLVMTLAGSLAFAAGNNWIYLFFLAILGSVGKTIGSYVIYVISDKAEDVIISKFGKFIGVSADDVEKISARLNSGTRDDIVLFLLRAIPIIPTAPVSVVCGLIKTKLKTYLLATFFGTAVRNIFYLYLGFTSVNAIESINSDIDTWEKLGYAIVLILVAVVFLYIFKLKRRNNN
jgi:membrane protein DedA with SNARE-associated domain